MPALKLGVQIVGDSSPVRYYSWYALVGARCRGSGEGFRLQPRSLTCDNSLHLPRAWVAVTPTPVRDHACNNKHNLHGQLGRLCRMDNASKTLKILNVCITYAVENMLGLVNLHGAESWMQNLAPTPLTQLLVQFTHSHSHQVPYLLHYWLRNNNVYILAWTKVICDRDTYVYKHNNFVS